MSVSGSFQSCDPAPPAPDGDVHLLMEGNVCLSDNCCNDPANQPTRGELTHGMEEDKGQTGTDPSAHQGGLRQVEAGGMREDDDKSERGSVNWERSDRNILLEVANEIIDDSSSASDGDADTQEKEDEEEEEEPEMTPEEKQEMYKAVQEGDIELLDDLLDKPGADINMLMYEENLLMASIRARNQEMAEWLVDNGIDHNYCATFVEFKDEDFMCSDWYTVSCRQMAYEAAMFDLVELIDYLNGDLWPFIQPKERVIRLKRSPEEKLAERLAREAAERGDEEEDAEEEEEQEEEMDGTAAAEPVIPKGSITDESWLDSISCTEERKEAEKETTSKEGEKNEEEEATDGSESCESGVDMSGRRSTAVTSRDSSPGSDSPRQHFRQTRTFFARKNEISERFRAFNENVVDLPLQDGMLTTHGSYGAESKRWATPRGKFRPKYDVTDAEMTQRNGSPVRVPSAPRTHSPWKDNDPVLEKKLRKRAQSAHMSDTINQRIQARPQLERAKSSLPYIGSFHGRRAQDTNSVGVNPVVRTAPTYAKIPKPDASITPKVPPRIQSASLKENNRKTSYSLSKKEPFRQNGSRLVTIKRFNWITPSMENSPVNKKMSTGRKYSPAGYIKTTCVRLTNDKAKHTETCFRKKPIMSTTRIVLQV